MILKKINKNVFLAITLFVATVAGTFATASPVAALGRTEAQFLSNGFALRYAALGDSVAAGLGLPVASNASPEDIACGRSPLAYESLVAAGVNAELQKFHLQLTDKNIACQRATLDNLSQAQTIGSVTAQPQLDTAFAQGTPALATLTMGANDVQWANFIGLCFSANNCDTPANTQAVNALIAAMQTKLTAGLQDIRSRSHFLPPLVVVTGYYQPISELCVNPALTTDEVAWLRDRTNEFNNALQTATNQAWFARFAPIDFTSHDICSADPWIQRPGVPGEPAPFHPNARGQQAMAEATLDAFGL